MKDGLKPGVEAEVDEVLGRVVALDAQGLDRATETGQVRTNQFIGFPWMLREFKLQRACTTCAAK